VDEVMIRGAERSGADVVAAATRLDTGDPLIGVDTAEMTERIESLPWVASVSVERHVSGTVDVEVIERVPVATASQAGRPMLIDREGQILAPLTDDTDLPSLPSIGELRPADVLGEVVRDHQRHVAEILATLPDSVRES